MLRNASERQEANQEIINQFNESSYLAQTVAELNYNSDIEEIDTLSTYDTFFYNSINGYRNWDGIHNNLVREVSECVNIKLALRR